MSAVMEQGSGMRWHSRVMILVAVNSVFRIVAVLVFMMFNDGTDWSNPKNSAPLIISLLPIFILLAIIYYSWREKLRELKCYFVIATVGVLANVVGSIFGFAEGNALGLFNGITGVINAPPLAALVYVTYRRIKEIILKARAPMDAETNGLAA